MRLFLNLACCNSQPVVFRFFQETKEQEAKQLEMAERGQGKQTAVREAEVRAGERVSVYHLLLSRQ